ncbi:MAG: acyl-CoA reductase [Flavobacteriaceae bacterium]|nr:acyl-CoA reductase [Flavobacteriaceae bacterium]
MNFTTRIKSLSTIGSLIRQFVIKETEKSAVYYEYENVIRLAEQKNPWFTRENILYALNYWGKVLSEEIISNWLTGYNLKSNEPKNIGLVLAGNIPMVGLHDCLCVLLTGNRAKIKLSSKDDVLIPFVLNLWKEFCPEIEFEFISRLNDYDAVITTGSDNTARYFEYYFSQVPHIIRKNRTSLAVFTGSESDDDLKNFAQDVFLYFGLGCRNVTQIFIPENHDLDLIFKAFLPYQNVVNHNKYANNYDYNKAVYLLNKDIFWENNFVLLKESDALYSPLAVLFFKRYQDFSEVEKFVSDNHEKIQCTVGNGEIGGKACVPFGETQNPKINDYADGVDTVRFLINL